MIKILKSFQRNIFNLARTPLGAILFIILIFITLNSILHFLETFIGVAIINKASFYDSPCVRTCQFSDNINQKNFQEELCYKSFDIVYTWVFINLKKR